MRRERGMTLIEILTVVGVAAILAMVAVPSFSKLAANQRLKAAAGNLQAAFLQARSEGLKRNANVTVAPTSGTNWNVGWSITDSSGSTVLGAFPAAANLTIAGPASVTYQSSGRVTASASFTISSTTLTDVRCVKVGVTGVPTVTSSTVSVGC